MSKTVFILIVLISVSLFSQKQKATLYLRNGTVLEGFARFANFEEAVKFKKNKEEKIKTFNYKELDRLIIDMDGEEVEFQYKIITNKRPKFFRVKERGLISLYFTKHTGGYIDSFGINGTSLQLGYSKDVIIYYLGNGDSPLIQKITPTGQISRKEYLKKFHGFFKDCPELFTKINNKELKRENTPEIVTFYNTHCYKL